MKTWVVLLFFPGIIWAAANIPAEGKGQIFVGTGLYEASSEFGKNESVRAFDQNGKFQKTELSYFTVYSVKKNIAILATGNILNQLTFKNDLEKNAFTGSGDQGLGARYLVHKNAGGASAFQILGTFPLYSKRSNPSPGNRQNDLELRYLRDLYQIGGLDFLSGELALRFRNSTPSDQFRFDLSGGKESGKFLIIGQLSYLKGMRNDSGLSRNTNPYASNDFDLLKLGPSVAYRYEAGEAIQLGYMKDLAGRNIGKGNLFFLQWWKDFSL